VTRTLLAASLSLAQAAVAATVDAASCSAADVQAAVQLADAGDTVVVPGPCSVAWPAQIAVSGITVSGGDGGVTVTQNGFAIGGVAAVTRITGFTFTDPGSTTAVRPVAVTASGAGPFRIDHNVFQAGGGSSIGLNDNSPGLIDHNVFTADTNGRMISNQGLGPSDPSGWTDVVTPGSAQMVFVEDNSFTGSPPMTGTAAVEMVYGSRTVVRHNVITLCDVYAYSTAGSIRARWWEIYENTFQAGGPAMDLGGGSGVIFDNHALDAEDIEFQEQNTGSYPQPDQVGFGQNQTPTPAFVWGNDGGFSVSSSSSLIVEGRDYFLSAPDYPYAPYPYPHPLQRPPELTARVSCGCASSDALCVLAALFLQRATQRRQHRARRVR
jgi:hypothetical protein